MKALPFLLLPGILLVITIFVRYLKYRQGRRFLKTLKAEGYEIDQKLEKAFLRGIFWWHQIDPDGANKIE
jgi:hypothetical protein